jgi:hypothetical protein
MLWLFLLPELFQRWVLVIDFVLALFIWWVICAVGASLLHVWGVP